MSEDNDEPAFPVPDQPHSGGLNGYYGMSLRDYFAAKAMQGLISTVDQQHQPTLTGAFYAEIAYRIADAMLAERAK